MNADNTLHPSAFIRVFRVIRVLHRMNLPDKIKDFGLEQIYREANPYTEANSHSSDAD
jgi:hypothetical protein